MIVKICGIIHPEDARVAAHLGANYIGIIFANDSKLYVEPCKAKEIALAAQESGATPVGVFTDHTLFEIRAICEEVGISSVQLHGSRAKGCLDSLDMFEVIFACTVCGARSEEPQAGVDWLLYDSKGDTARGGVPFDWEAFSPPSDQSWMLAGGLTPENVGRAVQILRPNGIDLSSGVGVGRKDPALIERVITTVRGLK